MWEFRVRDGRKKKRPQKTPLRPERPAPRSSSFLSEAAEEGGGGRRRQRREEEEEGGH